MSYESKLAQAIELINVHNSNLEKEDQIDINQFQNKLKKLGGTTEDVLQECSWEDLESTGLPRILAKKVSSIFRFVPKMSQPITTRSVERMSLEELVSAYKPKENPSVSKRLEEISKGQKFIVYTNKSLNVELSVKLLKEIQDGYEGRDIIYVDGIPCKTYKIGEGLNEWVDQNPIYQNRPLRPDGTCDQLNRSWEGVSLYIKQLVAIAVQLGETKTDLKSAHDLLDIALSKDAEDKLCRYYPKAVLRYQEYLENNQLPTLRMKLSEVGVRKANNNPFFQVKE